MGGIKQLMDETAQRMEIVDPNDPCVKAEVSRLLSVLERRLVVVESHPNSGGFWVGKVGTAREIGSYLQRVNRQGQLDYVFAILELKGAAKNEVGDWLEQDEDGPLGFRGVPVGHQDGGTPPLPGLEKRVARITSNAYGQRRSVWSILQGMTDVEIELVFNGYLEDVLQRGLTLPQPPETKMVCTSCGWVGRPDETVTVYVPNGREPGDVVPEVGCPECRADTLDEVSAK